MTTKFKDFGIKAVTQPFSGDSIKIDKILNREIIVHRFKKDTSQFKGTYMTMEIEIGNERRVVFTGAKFLQEMIEQVPKEKFPFVTTIIKENEHFEFT